MVLLKIDVIVIMLCIFQSTTVSRVSTLESTISTKQDAFTVTTVQLPSGSWSGNSQSVAVSGITPDTEIVIVSYATDSYDAYVGAGVRATAQGSGTLTFVCDSVPESTVSAEVMYS